ncbi:MAG: glycosyltransferase family 4 protein [Phyllobacterium sp.]
MAKPAETVFPSQDEVWPSVDLIEVIAPNFKKRLSGVTSTIVQLIPLQRADGLRIATLGPGLPAGLPKLRFSSLFGLWKKPKGRPFRIWHARRNTEMAAGVILRDVLRMPLRLVFTSASQRDHKGFTRWLIRRMDAAIATSARTASYLHVPHTVIMHGIDMERFHPPRVAADRYESTGLPGHYAIGCFGRIRHQKGTDLFVDAMIHLLPSYPEWTAVVAGRATPEHATYEKDLREKVTEAGLADRIIFLGELPLKAGHDDVCQWYRRLTASVAPSRHEGFGLTPLEAMASRTAVIASDAGAYPELIEQGRTGFVVPRNNLDAMAEAIERYLDDPALALRHGENGLAFVTEHFPLTGEAAGIRAVYEEVWAKG